MSNALVLGDMEIRWLQGGEFELDGGTMFGVVPKVLWERKYPVTTDNYIHMLNSPLLIKTPDALVVVETGLGNKLTGKQQKIFRITVPWDLPGDLDRHGYSRDDITHVVLTHCDFDHAGGIVMHARDGTPEITFPNAKHIVQKDEWHDAMNPNIRSASTYFPENFQGLEDSGLLLAVEGDHEVVTGIRLAKTGGHTRGHQVV